MGGLRKTPCDFGHFRFSKRKDMCGRYSGISGQARSEVRNVIKVMITSSQNSANNQ